MVIINIRDNPQWVNQAVRFFASSWQVPENFYNLSITLSTTTLKTLPRWYIMLEGQQIIGGFGLLENYYNNLPEPYAWLCALFVDPDWRGQALGSRLLEHGRREAYSLGFDQLFLDTDHIGYYEHYDWHYIGEPPHLIGSGKRVYVASGIPELEEMSAFFDARADIYDSHMLDDLNLTVFYERIDACLNGPLERLLDLGCGTGLQLERLLKRNPRLKLTAIDLSGEMLARLSKKLSAYPLEYPIELIQASFFEINYTAEFDCVLSTYALHHFSESDKLQLYTCIHQALRPGGRFVFGDYIASSIEQQQQFLAENQSLRQAKGLPASDFYHFDTPFTRDSEIHLMRQAGFTDIELIAEWDNTVIIVARK